MENKLVAFVNSIADAYLELSHDKVLIQRNEWVRRARKLRDEIAKPMTQDEFNQWLRKIDDDF